MLPTQEGTREKRREHREKWENVKEEQDCERAITQFKIYYSSHQNLFKSSNKVHQSPNYT